MEALIADTHTTLDKLWSKGMDDTSEYLHKKYGPLITLNALADLFDRSPDGLRMTLCSKSEFANALNEAKIKYGRRVYFKVTKVAMIIDQGSL